MIKTNLLHKILKNLRLNQYPMYKNMNMNIKDQDIHGAF